MTKSEKLRKNLENKVLELKEAWSEFEKERESTDTNSNSRKIKQSSNSSQINVRSGFQIK